MENPQATTNILARQFLLSDKTCSR